MSLFVSFQIVQPMELPDAVPARELGLQMELHVVVQAAVGVHLLAALSAFVRRREVDLHVVVESRREVERLTALVAPILRFAVELHVLPQLGLRLEEPAFGAQLAFVVPHLAVRGHVFPQTALLGEALPAVGAHVRSFAGVRSVVDLKFGAACEVLEADVAPVRVGVVVHRLVVISQTAFGVVILLADFTFKFFRIRLFHTFRI